MALWLKYPYIQDNMLSSLLNPLKVHYTILVRRVVRTLDAQQLH